ncbi:MAG: response regulator [Opitutaceae bacterium]
MDPPAEVANKTLGVLIVEDEGLVALDLEERLTKLGYEVVGTVDNGADALRFAHTVKVDLVLMDIHILGEIDGIETAAALRKDTNIPIVFLTSHADEATLQRAGLTEPFGYVLKPFDERELRATLQMAHYRHRAESRLRKMERWLATTLHSIGDGVIAADSEGRITLINAVAEALSGWTRGDAIGRHLSEVFAISSAGGPDETNELLGHAMTDGVTMTFGEGRFLRARDGRLIPVDDSLSPIRDDKGFITGCVVIFRDHTTHLEAEEKRHQLEAKMLEAQRLESLGVLASGIAHDFNNLLLAITCGASLGRTMVPEESPLVPCLKGIEEAAERAAMLCNQMLDYGGKSQRSVQEVELSGFTRETLQLLQAATHKNITLVFDLADGLPSLRADRSQLQQVIMNLVINGSEAMEGREGKLVVRTGRFAASRAFLSSCHVGAELSEGDYLLLEVRDTGHGISPEVIGRIFDPFFTTKFTGRGLGLAAISGIVRSHGGALAVQSTPGVGTIFRALFPPVESTSKLAPPPPPDLSWRGSGKVLLVDDDLAIRLLGEEILRRLGFEVETAEDGVEAVKKTMEAMGEYRVVLLDLTMPRLDGHGAYRAIRETHPSLPILLISGYSPEQAEHLVALGGPVAFLQKPFKMGGLAAALQALLADSLIGTSGPTPKGQSGGQSAEGAGLSAAVEKAE